MEEPNEISELERALDEGGSKVGHEVICRVGTEADVVVPVCFKGAFAPH